MGESVDRVRYFGHSGCEVSTIGVEFRLAIVVAHDLVKERHSLRVLQELYGHLKFFSLVFLSLVGGYWLWLGKYAIVVPNVTHLSWPVQVAIWEELILVHRVVFLG